MPDPDQPILNKRPISPHANHSNSDHMDHPIAKSDITPDNFKDIANYLFLGQCKVTADYLTRIHETKWWGDDDTDYTTTACEVPLVLQSIAYDGDHTDLIAFLYEGPDDPGPQQSGPLSSYACDPLTDDLMTYANIHWGD